MLVQASRRGRIVQSEGLKFGHTATGIHHVIYLPASIGLALTKRYFLCLIFSLSSDGHRLTRGASD